MNLQMTRFESLPNEIIIECFRYFHGVDLLLSFDQLNYRFNQLVRAIQRLFIDFTDANLLKFNKFCAVLSSNPELNDQIYSLELSNRSMCEIHLFLSRFSLDQFTNLRSLTLIEAQEHDEQQLQANHSAMSGLFSLKLLDYKKDGISNWISTLDILMQTEYNFGVCLQKLTIQDCNHAKFQQILKKAIHLTYLEINLFTGMRLSENDLKYPHKNLIKLKIRDLRQTIGDLKIILHFTPRLQNLSVCQFDCREIMDGRQWEQMINDFLPNLKVFQFNFAYQRSLQNETIYEQFQSDFWTREHQWYTECLLYKYFIVIYTIPYLAERYTLLSTMDRYSHRILSNSNMFNRVKHLEIKTNQIRGNNRFSQVESIVFDEQLTETIINGLPSIIDMNLLKSLIFPRNCRLKDSLSLSTIFAQAPHISSLSINPGLLIPLLNENKHLCEHLTRMIRKLDISIYSYDTSSNFYQMNLFWKVFVNIKQLVCVVDNSESVGFLFNHLSELLRLDISGGKGFTNLNASIIHHVNKVGLKILAMHTGSISYLERTVWIIRDTTNL